MRSILFIGFVWPEPKSSAAGLRMMQLIHFFLDRDYEITFASTASKTELSENLESLGISEVSIKLNDAEFDDFISQLNPEIVLFDRFMTEEQFGWRVKEKCPNSVLILDTEDLHFLRKARELQHKNNVEDVDLSNEFAKREIASIYRCDLSLIISEYELQLLKVDFKIDASLLLYLPYLLEEITEKERSTLPGFNSRKDFVVIGNFRHLPNFDAVNYLKSEIWPRIKKELPEVEVHIYGSYCNKAILSLTDKKLGFIIKGFAESVDSVMKDARLSLAAVRFGAGLKGKVMDSFKNGTPCVMTTIAAEGIFENFEGFSFIQDEPEKFAAEAIDLYNNPEKWKNQHSNGFEIIKEKFNKDAYSDSFAKTIENLLKNLPTHRKKNFIGSMLQHHTLQSTKYLSKWIEEKNK
ncbi:Glycosyl transferases group 1 [Flavobacteriaceae bacterium MAR_2010_188]|nr:Glycosyl transferases group 1 [Flavobacteriaceae bacterium MAR_2010_188]